MRESQKQTGKKYAQFSLVGLSNMLVDVGALNLLLILAPTGSPGVLVIYNAAALVLANANSYLWNTLWTFKDQARHDTRQAGMFTAQGLLNVAVGSALLWLAAHGLRAHTDLSPWVGGNAAKAISTVTASTVSFLFLRLFVFRPKEALVRQGVRPRREVNLPPDRRRIHHAGGGRLVRPCLRGAPVRVARAPATFNR